MTWLFVEEVAWCPVDTAEGCVPVRLFPNSCSIVKQENLNINFVYLKTMKLFPLGFEPVTFCMSGVRNNHYTKETDLIELNPR